MNPVQHSDTHERIDSTKLTTYMECPRKFFFEYVLGWRPDVPSFHLHAGASFHLAMEKLLWRLHKDGNYTQDAADEAFTDFLTEYRKHFSEVDDHLRSPKDPVAVRWALDEYIKYYQSDRFEVLHTEVAGSVPLTADGHWIWFNIDALYRDKEDGSLRAMDHKTTKSFDRNWQRKWRLTTQFGTYTHALRCLFGDDFWGIVVNGVALASPPRLKKDGQPYANQADKAPAFLRATVRHTPDTLEAWYMDILHQYTAMQRDMERLAAASDSDPVLVAFPRNYTACSNYGGCPFMAFCDSWSNPLQQCHHTPIGFRVEHWDPKARLDAAKAVVTCENGTVELKEQTHGDHNG